MSIRLRLALESGLNLGAPISVVLPRPEHDLSVLPGPAEIVQPFRPFFDHFRRAGFRCVPDGAETCAGLLLFLPRSKAQSRALIADACRRTGGIIAVDGAKTDGIDSLLRDIRRRTTVEGIVTKAHGKLFWFHTDAERFADWAAAPRRVDGGFVTVPGIFSADGIDPASRLLADALPDCPGRHVADLGGGWGYLAARILAMPDIETYDLVEADHTALACARENTADPRIRFHWADATNWQAPGPVDAVVMNPPFHTGRAAEPDLGRAFIAAAARILKPAGTLWLVANRHLPYEQALGAGFAEVTEIGGDNRFKLLRAARPSRPRR